MLSNPKGYPIDLNADLGEGSEFDAELLLLITSANIACGGHAGDPLSMRKTVIQALKSKVNVGAHPSFPDRENFGRVSIDISGKQLSDSIYQQIMALRAICDELGAKLFHVKPHGAFYNEVAKDKVLGRILIDVIKRIDPELKLMILAGSPLVKQARQHGLTVIEEAFADRTYLSDGSLAPRSEVGAVIHDPQQALQQVRQIVGNMPVTTLGGQPIIINATSICLHGDNQQALEFAKLISENLTEARKP
ncbi:LamB/YcsF family protein [Shewanella sediminis HAW-EB3]|uniref:LamB/YcsF family protein n=1 Tax=Shewanella sediminis (strain HAW-EB3) TaxID=425104 RepID=A8FP50_SHESH|nr:5-oxoprolinase subunit PxpA [Shewanella sediminis]ABV34623.1 LamB/YcsF family protein [Shewanella sediminis HAW-EB3]